MTRQHSASAKDMAASVDFKSLVLEAIRETSPNPGLKNKTFDDIAQEQLDGQLLSMDSQDITDMWSYINSHLPPGAKPVPASAQASCKTPEGVRQALLGAQA